MRTLIGNTLVLILLFTQSVAAQDAGKPFVEIGIVDLSGAQAKIVMGAETATRPGIFVHLIFIDPAASSVLLTRKKLGWEMAGAENPQPDATTYKTAASDRLSGRVGFALYGPILDFAVIDGVPQIDLTGDGQPETLSACLTAAGIRLTVQSTESTESGVPETIWQQTVALPEVSEPNCPN